MNQSTTAEKAAQLRAFNDSLLDDDLEMLDADGASNKLLEVSRTPDQSIEFESIIMRRRRPVLAIQKGTAVLDFKDEADVPLWQARLTRAANLLEKAIPSVGRMSLRAILTSHGWGLAGSSIQDISSPTAMSPNNSRAAKVMDLFCSRDRTAQ